MSIRLLNVKAYSYKKVINYVIFKKYKKIEYHNLIIENFLKPINIKISITTITGRDFTVS